MAQVFKVHSKNCIWVKVMYSSINYRLFWPFFFHFILMKIRLKLWVGLNGIYKWDFYDCQGFQHKRPWANTYAHRRMQNLKYCISYKIVCQEWPIFTLHSVQERIWIKWLPQGERRPPKDSKSRWIKILHGGSQIA